MAKKSQKRSKQNKAKKMDDLPAGPKAKNVKGGRFFLGISSRVSAGGPD